MADGARQALGTVTTRMGSLLLAMIASVVVARSIQPAGRGTYHLAVTTAGAAIALGNLSVEQAQTALWTQSRLRRAVAANSLLLGVLVGGLAALVTMALVVLAVAALTLPHLALVGLAVAGVPLGVCVVYIANITMLNARMNVVNKASLAGAVFQCGALIALGLTARLTVVSVVAIWVASMAVPCYAMIRAGRLGLRGFDPAVAWSTVRTGLSYHLGPASIFLLLRVDVFILAAQVSARSLGIYSLAVSIAEMSGFAADAVSQVALPRQAQEDQDEAAAVTARMTRLTVLAGSASVFAIATAAPVIVPVAYGGSYAGAAPMLLLLAPGVLALGVSRPSSAFLLRLRSARSVIVPPVVALAVNVVCNLLLIPGLGAAGCSIASSVGYAVMAALQIRFFVRVSGVPARSLLPGARDVRAFASQLRASRSRPSAQLR